MSSTAEGSSMNGSSSITTEEVFDISTPTGAVDLLRRVHVSALPIEVKNQLRDAIFSLQNSALTTNVEAVRDLFATHGITVEVGTNETFKTPTIENKEKEKAVISNQGFGRPAPRFATPSTVKVKDSKTNAEEVVPASKTQPTPSVDMGTDNVPAEKVVIRKEAEISDIESNPGKSSDSAERIKEIKHTINGLVGNPVNLIDVDNEVGREYMNSLLDAMKKVNIGVEASDMERAMNRLEVAFAAAQETLRTHEKKEEENQEVTTEERHEMPSADTEDSDLEENLTQEEPIKETLPKEDVANLQQETPKTAVSTEKTDTLNKTEEENIPVNPDLTEKEIDVDETAVTKIQPVAIDLVEKEEATDIVTPTEEKTVTKSEANKTRFTAVAKEKQLKQLIQEQDDSFQKKEQQQEAIDSSKPLMARDITIGLEQLLSEWKLFKSSGIFGTGPSGVDHPLYKKLAPLSMAAVMTGRFEDASSDVKQNITEYMSGWRYEEGIVYEPSETFEHYLRRVIKHILDKREDVAVDKTK